MRLFVDPGLRACGVALFRGGHLVAAGFPTGAKDTDTDNSAGRASTWSAMASAVAGWCADRGEISALTIEFPQVRRSEHQRAEKKGTDPNDLVMLAAVVGAICDRFRGIDVRTYLPEQWKGQVPKDIHHARAKTRLNSEEIVLIPKLPKSKLHNVMDAIAMGLWDAGRL